MTTSTERVVPGRRGTTQVLADCRALTLPALRAAVDRLPNPTTQVAGYHLGWLNERGQPVDNGGGKMIRPSLTLLSAQAVGGHAGRAVPAAVAVELVHNFSLLHDDVIDGDRTRRHRPTAWAAFGIPAAVLAGDALWALALQILADVDGASSAPSVRVLVTTLGRLMEGQCADVDFSQRARVSLAECEDMAAGKTGAVLGCACALGALAGGGSPTQVSCLQQMGERLGMAFQLVDDLLGIWGDPTVTGKPAGADLTNRKKSLPVVAALTSGTAAGEELAGLYHRERLLAEADLERAADLVDQAGGRAWAQREAERHLNAARSVLHQADPVPAVAEELKDLAGLIARRDH